MKVLFISSGKKSDQTESPGIVVYNQGESLKRFGLHVEYFLIREKGLMGYFYETRRLRQFLKRNKFDIIHAHYSLSGIAATFAGCKPLVVSMMGSDTKSGTFWKLVVRVLNFLRWDSLIVKSDSMKRSIGIYDALILSNGVDLSSVKPESIYPYDIKDKSILFAADPKRSLKNYSLAEKAVSLLNDESINLKVVHSVTHSKVIEEINKSTLVLSTSLWEGSPNIVKEAMACNCPVVSTNVGDVEWLFGDELGHFIAEPNPKGVAEKIKEAIEFSHKHGRTKGRQRIKRLGLDSDTVANELITVYKEILEKRS